MPGARRDYLRPQLCDFGHSCIYQRVGSVNSACHAARCAARNEAGRARSEAHGEGDADALDPVGNG
jgi:hypothetical protein